MGEKEKREERKRRKKRRKVHFPEHHYLFISSFLNKVLFRKCESYFQALLTVVAIIFMLGGLFRNFSAPRFLSVVLKGALLNSRISSQLLKDSLQMKKSRGYSLSLG